MAWFVVPDTTDPDLVCQEPCDHTDCAATRRFDSMRCRICGQGFEAGQRFYYEGDGAVHGVCLEKEARDAD